jgi:hypothetical protein
MITAARRCAPRSNARTAITRASIRKTARNVTPGREEHRKHPSAEPKASSLTALTLLAI